MTPELAARLEALLQAELDGGSLDVALEIELWLSCNCDLPHGCRLRRFYR